MRNPSEDLFKLINELTPREKAHFRKLASLQVSNGEPEYLQVFDEIAKQKQYDESAIKKKFKGRPFISNFHKMKDFIYGNLLDSLHHFHRKSNQLSEMLNLPPRIEILYEKGLYDQSLALARRLLKLAESLKSNSHISYAVRWELRLLFLRPSKEIVPEQIWNLHERLDMIADQAKSANQYLRSHSELFAEYYTNGAVLDREGLNSIYERIKAYPAYADDAKPVGFVAESYYLNFLEVYYDQKQDGKRAFETTEKLYQLYASNPEMLKGSPHAMYSFIQILYNRTSFEIQNGDCSAAEESLKELEGLGEIKIVKSSKRLRSALFTHHTICGLLLHRRCNRVKQGHEFAQSAIETIETGKVIVADNHACEIKHQGMLLAYLRQESKLAMTNANSLWQHGEKVMDKGRYQLSMLLRAVLYFESETESVREAVIKSTIRSFNESATFKSFQVFVKMLSRLSRVQSTCVIEGVLENSLAELQRLKMDKFEARAFEEFDMCRWITMRVMGLHYSHGMEKDEAQLSRQSQLANEDAITGSAIELARSSS